MKPWIKKQEWEELMAGGVLLKAYLLLGATWRWEAWIPAGIEEDGKPTRSTLLRKETSDDEYHAKAAALCFVDSKVQDR